MTLSKYKSISPYGNNFMISKLDNESIVNSAFGL